MVAKKHPRGVDCDIVWYGDAVQRSRLAKGERGASRLPPALFVMQIVALAATAAMRRAALRLILYLLPAATAVIIVKNIHLSAFIPALS